VAIAVRLVRGFDQTFFYGIHPLVLAKKKKSEKDLDKDSVKMQADVMRKING